MFGSRLEPDWACTLGPLSVASLHELSRLALLVESRDASALTVHVESSLAVAFLNLFDPLEESLPLVLSEVNQGV